MEQCDVLIVGGGPAGSSCAWGLRDSGLDVRVMDRALFPRDKICAGWITPAVADVLELDLGAFAASHTLQPITGFRTGCLGGADVETRYLQPVSYGIRRCEFDAYLLERSGARLLLGTAFKSLRKDGDGWVVNEVLCAKRLVGAGGHFCPVARTIAQGGVEHDMARRAGAGPTGSPGRAELPEHCLSEDGQEDGQAVARSRPGEPAASRSIEREPDKSDHDVVLAQEIEFRLTPEQQRDCPIRGDTPELWFCRDLRGYGWCFRKGEYLNVGLGRESERHLSDHVARFRELLIERGRIPPDTPARFHGHAYRLYRAAPSLAVPEGLLLIGDAAGLAYPESGEGIRPAIESGLMAAQILRQPRGSPGAHAQLQGQLTRRFGPRRSKRSGALACLPAGWVEAAGSRLLSSRWFARHVVLDRWFLHRHQPAWQPEPAPA